MSAIGRWLGYEHMELASPLSADDCARRLRDAVEGGGTLSDEPPVVGSVGAEMFRLRKRLAPGSRNSFQTYLTGKMVEAGGSTRLVCRTGLHPFVVAFMAFWFLMPIAMAIGFFASGVVQGDAAFVPAMTLPMMGIFGLGLVVVARRVARGEKDFLLDFLAQTLSARGAPSAGSRAVERVSSR